MADDWRIEVRGLREAQRKVEKIVKDLVGEPMLNAMRDATLMVQRDAKINAPVDTGRLRASITPGVRMAGDVVIGVVGSNVKYAPYMEFGTRPHWPPLAAVEVWARRHGMSAYLVARSIAMKGTKARRYLQRAFESNKDKMIARFRKAIGQIIGQ